jgi:hypothetical protein
MELHHRPPFPLCIMAANLLLQDYKRCRDLPRASPRSLPTPTLLLHARVATSAPRHWATTAIPPSTAAVGENRPDTSLFLLHYDELHEPGAPCSVCLCKPLPWPLSLVHHGPTLPLWSTSHRHGSRDFSYKNNS